MSEDLLLTELCMICHTNPYKYCCPRCSSRTCSLTCLKRHKQWASCNGIRDRAAYVKRKDLATPRAVDHDYNYLTSIERQLDIAERHAESRGICLYNDRQAEARKKAGKPTKGEIPLRAAIQQNRVMVDTAPKGMSRQKQNKTHWDSRKKRIVWTVEWVHKDGSRETGQCPGSEALNAAYSRFIASSPSQKTGKAEVQERLQKKRRLDIENPTMTAQVTETKSKKDQASAITTKGITADPMRSLIVAQPYPSSSQSKPQELYFYLLLPSTPTSYRVLIPLTPQEELAQALADRFVLEFPTIYALKQPPDNLPTGFKTEVEYLKGMAENGPANQHLDELLSQTQNGEDGWSHGAGKQAFDEGALKAVIKQDLISVVDAG
ncbi:MAG: hypothetical protein Q9202_002638 [Teloschistes flavicans]